VGHCATGSPLPSTRILREFAWQSDCEKLGTGEKRKRFIRMQIQPKAPDFFTDSFKSVTELL
jgi:hypothetical protein